MSVIIGTHGMFLRIIGLVEHAAAIIVGLILMVVGLGLAVTMVLLPVGLIVGFTGLGMLLTGLFAHFDGRR